MRKTVLTIIISGLLFASIGVYAATTLASSSVSYDNTTSGGSSTNVQGAVDELYSLTDSKYTEGYNAGVDSVSQLVQVTSKTYSFSYSTSTSFSVKSTDISSLRSTYSNVVSVGITSVNYSGSGRGCLASCSISGNTLSCNAKSENQPGTYSVTVSVYGYN